MLNLGQPSIVAHNGREVKYIERPVSVGGDRRDCVVSAIAVAFQLPMETADQVVTEQFGRKRNRGVEVNNIWKAFGKGTFVGKKIKRVDNLTRYINKGEVVFRAMTVGTFLKKYKEGRYMLIIRGHAFAVVDGAVVGNLSDARRLRARVISAHRVVD